MKFWSLYFLAKIALHHLGYLSLQVGWNMLLAAWLFWPVQARGWRRLRLVAGSALCAVLAWRESPLPPFVHAFEQIKLLRNFSADYVLELLGRLVDLRLFVVAMLVVVVYAVLAVRIRFATFAWLGLASVALWPSAPSWNTAPVIATGTANPVPANTTASRQMAVASNAELDRFFQLEGAKQLQFPPTALANFDVVILHVCSLSWDDMDFVRTASHPFLSGSSIVFTQFNSATSYSGPASLRLLHGACGQASHASLYEGQDPRCYVFPALESSGFATTALLNHDGKFDGFAKEIEERGGLRGKLQLPSGPGATLRSFDNSLIYGDYESLASWHQARVQSASQQPVALYYNSITLHDGVRPLNSNVRDSLGTYQPRLQQMLDDFQKFYLDVQASGRPTVLMMVPEHGANLRGDSMQIAGMREIPSPRITLVPAVVTLVNAPGLGSAPIVVDEPMSYFDLFTLLNDFIEDSPFKASSLSLNTRLTQLVGTPFVTESAAATVMQTSDGRYWVRSKASTTWLPYPDSGNPIRKF